MIQYLFHILLCLCILILPSCARRGAFKNAKEEELGVWSGSSKQQHYKKGDIDSHLAAKIIEKEARLDVPLPLQIAPRPNYFNDLGSSDISSTQDIMMVGYTTRMTNEQLVQFYNNQMECFGWKKIFSYTGPESLLIFQKPQAGVERLCNITIRPHRRAGTELIICSGYLKDDQKTFSYD